MKDEIAARLSAIRERERAATPGGWVWRGNKDSHSIDLLSTRSGWGDIVMDFQRWGTQRARPCFVVDGLIVKPEWVMGPAHHPWEIVGIDHPDARFIAAARTDVAYLLDVAEAAAAFLDKWYEGDGGGVETCEAAIELMKVLGGDGGAQ